MRRTAGPIPGGLILAGLILSALVGAACGSGRAASSPTSTEDLRSPPPSPAATQPGTTVAVSPAQAQYFSMWSDMSVDLTYLDGGYLGTIHWDDYPAYCAAVAPVVEHFSNEVARYAWPDDVRPEADAVVAATSTEVALYRQCEVLPSEGSAIDALEKQVTAAKAVSKAAEDALHLALAAS